MISRRAAMVALLAATCVAHAQAPPAAESTRFIVESSACTQVFVVTVFPPAVNVPVTSPVPSSSVIA